MDRNGSHVRALAPAFDRLQSQPTWTADGRAVVAAYADRILDDVGRLGMDGSVQVLARHSAEDYRLVRDGAVGLSLGASDRPAEAGVAAGGEQQSPSALNADLLGVQAM